MVFNRRNDGEVCRCRNRMRSLHSSDWIGLTNKHVVTLQEANSDQRQRFSLDQTPEALQSWIQELRNRFAGQPVAIAVEQKRGGLIYALMHIDFLRLYPVNPQTRAQFRK